MRLHSIGLNVPATAGAGTSVGVSHLHDLVVLFTTVSSGTFQMEVSTDGSTFAPFGAVVSAAGCVVAIPAVAAVRVRCVSDGAAVASLGGRQEQG